MKLQLMATIVALPLICGCASIGVRMDGVYEPGTLYPGTRMYLTELKQVPKVYSNDPDYQSDLGQKVDRVLLTCFLPFLIPDFLVLTPALDTVLLPYDGIRALTYDEKKDIQQDESTVPVKAAQSASSTVR